MATETAIKKFITIVLSALLIAFVIFFLVIPKLRQNKMNNENNDELSNFIATSADDAPTGSMHNLPVPDAVSVVRSKVASDLDVREGLVIVMTAYEKTWTNGCLDLAEPGEMCTEALVQGYEVSVESQGQSFTYHTNGDGSILREKK
jgi:hypothetical protein